MIRSPLMKPPPEKLQSTRRSTSNARGRKPSRDTHPACPCRRCRRSSAPIERAGDGDDLETAFLEDFDRTDMGESLCRPCTECKRHTSAYAAYRWRRAVATRIRDQSISLMQRRHSVVVVRTVLVAGQGPAAAGSSFLREAATAQTISASGPYLSTSINNSRELEYGTFSS
jgi:hypothetical protein